MALTLKIVSPEKVEFSGEIKSVIVPGCSGEFQILENHAPLISLLETGKVVYEDASGKHQLMIESGFVEIQKNEVSLCVEL
ncbi:MAG: ATP synthase F1 subunit epsilon [Prevotella sp.]|nr:ATP synthase F1 subunit epsilon [Prevotella sp.]MBQ2951651.1 ATP synthase F1 subunit epsilon [Prevotella sp.]MBR2017476.1 ATP synthase F1 subunit epsilon [Prevotella sp.]MBR2880955.1 ATP synthase F1 subunit epsilon [Prevotella sp.]MBR6606899.1 ATP synthase F1 subunit epsilon [Prevotella sp.]